MAPTVQPDSDSTYPPSYGGSGGLVTHDVTVTAGQTLFIDVGGDGQPGGANVGGSGGFNGGADGGDEACPDFCGGTSAGGGGGGASDVRTIGRDAATPAESLASRLVTAAGGGGSGGGVGSAGPGGGAGSAGGTDPRELESHGGGPGTTTGGGLGGTDSFFTFSPGQPGTLGVGGRGGGFQDDVFVLSGGGGGGGGVYGGGGGSGETYSGGGGGGANSDGSTSASDAPASVTITYAIPVPPTISGAPQAGAAGTPYQFTFTVAGTPPPTVTLSAGNLPTGLSLTPAGVITGTPSSGGDFPFTVTASNGVGAVATITTTVRVTSPPTITGAPSTAVVGTPYSFGYTIGGYPSSVVAVTSGTPPPGLTLSPAGVLSGTPTTGGPFTFEVTATNGTTSAAKVTSTVTVNQAPAIAGTAPAGMVGTGYLYAYQVTGYPAPTVTLTAGALPAGLTLSSAGLLSGTPTGAGTSTFTVTASNGVGPATSVTNTVTIAPANTPTKADLTFTVTAPSTGKVGTAYSYQVATKNLGPATATQVVTVFLIPRGAQLVSVTGNPVRIGQLLVWTTASVAANATVANTVTVKPGITGTNLAGGITGSIKTPDPKPLNNIAAAGTNITR